MVPPVKVMPSPLSLILELSFGWYPKIPVSQAPDSGTYSEIPWNQTGILREMAIFGGTNGESQKSTMDIPD